MHGQGCRNPILDTRISVCSPVCLCVTLKVPPWSLNRCRLESSGQRLISSFGQTKRIAFFCTPFFNWDFLKKQKLKLKNIFFFSILFFFAFYLTVSKKNWVPYGFLDFLRSFWDFFGFIWIVLGFRILGFFGLKKIGIFLEFFFLFTKITTQSYWCYYWTPTMT